MDTSAGIRNQDTLKKPVVILLAVFVGSASLPGFARGAIIGAFTIEQDISGSSELDFNVCVRSTPMPGMETWDVFGTTVTQPPYVCLGATRNGIPGTYHCESVPAGIAGMDVTRASAENGTSTCANPPVCSLESVINGYSNFTGPLNDQIRSNLPAGSLLVVTSDGTFSAALGNFIGGSSPIPGCSTMGPGYFHSEGVVGVNGFLAMPTDVGTDVTTTSTTSFFNPINQQEVPIRVDLTFSQVTQAGSTLVIGKSNDNAGANGNLAMAVDDFQSSFLDISTSALFSGTVTICTHYPDADNDGIIDGTLVPETSLTFQHGEGNPVRFVDRTTSRDLEGNVICGQVSHLSPFVTAPRATHVLTPITVNKCLSGKIKAEGTATAKYLSCQSQAAGDNIPAGRGCLGPASVKMVSAFSKLDTRARCNVSGDGPSRDTDVGSYAAHVHDVVTTSTSLPDSLECNAAKINLVGKYVQAKLKCYAKAAGKPGAVDSTCIDKAAAKFTAGMAKAELNPCSATSQGTILLKAADVFADEQTCLLSPGNAGC